MSPRPTATAAPVPDDEPVFASVPGPLSTPATPDGAVVGMIVDGETPADVGVGAVVGGTVVGGDVVTVVEQSTGSSTVAVAVLLTPSVHSACTVIVIAPVTPPGTTVVASVLAPPGTGFVTTETSYATPSALAVAVTVIAL